MSDDWRADVARAIADHANVDWAAVGGSSPAPTDPELVDELRILEQVARVHSEPALSARSATPALDVLPAEWGPLTVLEHIGRGTFGDVYRAHDPRLDRTVALKILRRQQPAEATAVIEEARLLARVSHPNVVTVYGAERIAGQVGVWMSFIDGATLEDELGAKGPFDPLAVGRIGLDLCAALDAVHRAGVVHHDVKTQNVMRAPDGRVVLADFGAGSDTGELGAAAGSDLAGTPLYLAPEVLEKKSASPQSDIYSLGVVLFHLLTGTFPIAGRAIDDVRQAHAAGERRRVREIRPDVPARLSRIVDRCLAPDPMDRFPDVASVAQALRRAGVRVWTKGRAMTTGAVVLTVIAMSLAVWRFGPGLVTPPVGSPSSSGDVMSVRRVREQGGSHVSADGRYLVGNSFVQDLATGAERPWYSETEDGGIGGELAVSRDGTEIAYEWCTAGPQCEVRVRPMPSEGLGTWRVLLSHPDRGTRFGVSDWSPDGRSILIQQSRADGSRDIGIVDARDGSLQILTGVGWRGARAFFSPDGRTVAYDSSTSDTDYRRDIFVMTLDGGPPIPAVVGEANDVLMGWTPDGSGLIFTSTRSGTTDLWAVPLSAERTAGFPQRLKAGIGDVRSVGVTKAGSLYWRAAENEVDIEVVSIDTTSGRIVGGPARPPQSVPGTNGEPAWSPDGGRLAYVSRRAGDDLAGTIAIYSVTTGETWESPPLKLTWAQGLSWAPDGKSLVLTAVSLQGACGLFRMDVNTGAISPIAYPIPLTFQGAHWSPSGTQLYFDSVRDGIFEWDMTRGSLRTISPAQNPQGSIGPISVSPDGRWFASYKRSGALLQSVMIGAIDGTRPRELFRFADGELDNIPMPWTPASDAVMVRRFPKSSTGPTGGGELWLIPLNGSAPRKLDVDLSDVVDGQLGKIRLSGDGKRMAYVVGKAYRREIWVLENFLPQSGWARW